MTTVINNPGGADSDSGMSMMVGVVLLLVVVFLFFVYGLPVLRQGVSNNSQPQINQPNQIDVNTNQPGTPGTGNY